jgi:hypothetical protein
MLDIPLLLDSKQYFLISHMISPTDVFHPPPTRYSHINCTNISVHNLTFKTLGLQHVSILFGSSSGRNPINNYKPKFKTKLD